MKAAPYKLQLTKGLCAGADLDEIAGHNYVLTPGRYVGAEEVEDDVAEAIAAVRAPGAEGGP